MDLRSRLQSIILDDLCEQIIDSEHKTAPIQLSGIPYVRTPNVKNTRLILDDAHRVSEETYKEWTKRIEPKPYDIILCREAPVGDSAMILPNQKICLGQRTVLIRANKEKIYPKYLLFLLNSPNVKHELLSNSGGTHVDHLNMKDIRSLNVEIFHSYDEQKIIGDLLFNLNSLIYSKEKQNQILEKTIQTIFKSWFIDFDGQTEFEDSKLGKIPKGWICEILDNFLERVTYGFTCPMPTSQDGPYMITSKDLEGDKINFMTSRKTTQQAFEKNLTDKSRPMKNDILLSKDGTLGRLAIVGDEKICINQSVAVLRPNSRINSYFLYYLLKSPQYQETMINHADGSVIQHIYITRVNQMFILVPEKSIKVQFEKICENIYKKTDLNFKKIMYHSKIRDSLLPKLMSGEIQV